MTMISVSKPYEMEKIPPLSQLFSIKGKKKKTNTRSIVAVHGIGAHPDRTWTMQNRNGDWVNWLTDTEMLPRNLPNARIMRFGYRSEWFGPVEAETKKTLVPDVSEVLLTELKHCRDVSRPKCTEDAVSNNKPAQESNSPATVHRSQLWRPCPNSRPTALFRQS